MRKMTSAAMISLGLVAACGGPGRIQETATTVPHRDLTLSTSPAPSTEVASRIELAVSPTTHRARRTRAAAPVRVTAEPETPVATRVPAPVAAAPAPAPSPAPVAEAPQADATGHELAPGRTVTIIPVSAGESSPGGGGGWSEVPAPRTGGVTFIGGRRGGGHCGSGGREGPISILE